MRASRRRWHHSISAGAAAVKLPAQNLALGFELRERDLHQVARQREIARQSGSGHADRWIRTSRAGSRRRSARAIRVSARIGAAAMAGSIGACG